MTSLMLVIISVETVCVGLVRYVTLTTFGKKNIITAK